MDLSFRTQRSQQKNNFHVSVGLVGIDNVFKALHGLKTTQNLSKNGPKTGPSPRDAASQNARSARAHLAPLYFFAEFRAPQVLRISGSQGLRFSGSQVLRDLGLFVISLRRPAEVS